MKIYLDNNLGVSNVEQEELTQDTIGYNILKVYIPNAVLTPYDTFTCYYGALLQNGRKVGWFAMEARTSTDADYEANYTLYKATLEQCVVSVEGKVYIGCQVLLGNSGNATLIKKNTAVVQFNVRKSVAINNDILVLDPDQTNTDVLESYKNLLENALTTYATKATTYTKTEVDGKLDLKADKSNTYTKTEVDEKDLNLAGQIAGARLELNNRINTTDGILTATQAEVAKLKSVQNVVEVVATKSALNSYDTTKLDVNDKVQVIADETHDGASTIYNWSGSAWVYVGAYGTNSYTKQESDNKFALKSTAVKHSGNQLQDENGDNIYPILEDGSISLSKINQDFNYRFNDILNKVNILKNNIDNSINYENIIYNSGYVNSYRFPSNQTSINLIITDAIDVSNYNDKSIKYILNDFNCYIGNANSNINVRFYDENNATLKTTSLINDGSMHSITVPTTASYIKIRLYLEYSISSNTDVTYGYANLIIFYGNKVLNDNITIDDLETLKNGFNNILNDINILFTQMNENYNQLDYLKTRITKLDDYVVPDYYTTHIQDKADDINALSGVKFIFITDLHSDNNDLTSKSLVDYLLNFTDVRTVINGGDAFTSNGTATENETRQGLRNITSLYSEDNDYYFVLGNHDTGIDTVGGQMTEPLINITECYNDSGLRKQYGKVTISNDSKFKYYWDDDVNHIRYIVCNIYIQYVDGTTWTKNWLWLADTLQSTPDGYYVIVLNHVLCNTGETIDQSMQDYIDILDAYNNRTTVQYGGNTSTRHNYTNATGKVILMLCGHTHKSLHFTSASGIPLIAVTTDNYHREKVSGVSRTDNDITKCAFTVVNINTNDGELNLVGIGAEPNYTFTF